MKLSYENVRGDWVEKIVYRAQRLPHGAVFVDLPNGKVVKIWCGDLYTVSGKPRLIGRCASVRH